MGRVWRLIGLGVVAAAAGLVGLCLLPHDPYVRWQDPRLESYARLGWIYERIHFDPTPVDVAIVGTSHSMNGIDGAAVARAAAEAGRPCLNVVNLAMPNYGRNLHWVIARELLRARPVRTLVLEVLENETRQAHPLFVAVADAGDVAGAPALVNMRYVTDLLLLPMRQALLFLKTLAPAQFGLRAAFDRASYDGPDVDNTRVVQAGGRVLTPPRDRRMDPDALRREAQAILADKRLHVLGGALAPYEYAVPDRYVPLILGLARLRGVEVLPLYLPGYGMPDAPLEPWPYPEASKMLFVNDVLRRPGNWGDIAHLNRFGAAELSARLGQLLAQRVPGPAAATCAAEHAPLGSGQRVD